MNSHLDDRDAFAALMRKDLSSFIQRAFLTVDPGSRYLHNWHVDAIAYALEQVAYGATTRLIITMPPRSLKSIAASVALPAWLLGHDPRQRVVAVSYAEALSEKLALDCLKVLEAPWFKEAFPMTRVARSRSARADFETTRGGGRFSTSVGGALTGRGGDIIIIDDPHRPDEVASEAKRTAVLDWYQSTLLSRLNDPTSGRIILIQQRLHEADLAGTLLEQGGWTHLDLPAIAEEESEVDLGRRGKVRRNEGDLLHAARLPQALLDRRKAELGSHVFAAQYQQRPAPRGGGLIKWEWFRGYDRCPSPAPGDRIVQSWDTASKADEANDYSVCSTWLVRDSSAWLKNIYRAKLEFPELRRQIEAQARDHGAGLILIEEVGSGLQLIQDLKANTRWSVKGIVPKDDKATRMLSVSHLIEGGRIAVPLDAPWLAAFQREVTLFPAGKHDDQVDSLSQFLKWFSQPQIISGTIRLKL